MAPLQLLESASHSNLPIAGPSSLAPQTTLPDVPAEQIDTGTVRGFDMLPLLLCIESVSIQQEDIVPRRAPIKQVRYFPLSGSQTSVEELFHGERILSDDHRAAASRQVQS